MHADVDVDGKKEILVCGTNSWPTYVEVIACCFAGYWLRQEKQK